MSVFRPMILKHFGFSAALVARMAEAGAEPEIAPEGAGFSLEGLWRKWSNDERVRALLLKSDSLFHWPSLKTTGIITFQSLGMNASVIDAVLDVWGPQLSAAKTIYLEHARDEAGLQFGFMELQKMCSNACRCQLLYACR